MSLNFPGQRVRPSFLYRTQNGNRFLRFRFPLAVRRLFLLFAVFLGEQLSPIS